MTDSFSSALIVRVRARKNTREAMERRSSRMLPRKVAADESAQHQRDDLCGRDGTRGDGCAYTTLRKMACSMGTDASGKPVQKCEKTEQLLRKCAGRPVEVVDSKTEAVEEDALSKPLRFSLDYDNNGGSSHQWNGRILGPGGASTRGEYPLGGLFERSSPGSFEELVQDVFGNSFGSPEEVERAQPPTMADENKFGWFMRGLFGGQQPAAAGPASTDQSNSKQKTADYYEGLARGVQEV